MGRPDADDPPTSAEVSGAATFACELPEPKPAADDCLPHAAMGLGSVRAVGTSPRPALVHRVVVQRQMSAWCLFRLDDAGGFVGETWHPDAADAIRTACREFGLTADRFREVGR